jgi:hypothetical protein
MHRILTFAAILMFAASLISCGKPTLTSEQLVIVIDVSASIEIDSEQQAFAAIDSLIAHRQRGERIAVIPITGDAQADTPGRVLRFEVPIVRQAYDNDLRQFRNKVKMSLEEFKAHAISDPGTHTDILGAVALAQQELCFRSSAPKQGLVILSDFIQDDSELKFLRDKRLASRTAAKHFALESVKAKGIDLHGIPVYLGMLRSKDYKATTKNRREAIQEFWVQYFNSSGAKATYVADGVGRLLAFDTHI